MRASARGAPCRHCQERREGFPAKTLIAAMGAVGTDVTQMPGGPDQQHSPGARLRSPMHRHRGGLSSEEMMCNYNSISKRSCLKQDILNKEEKIVILKLMIETMLQLIKKLSSTY